MTLENANFLIAIFSISGAVAFALSLYSYRRGNLLVYKLALLAIAITIASVLELAGFGEVSKVVGRAGVGIALWWLAFGMFGITNGHKQ